MLSPEAGQSRQGCGDASTDEFGEAVRPNPWPAPRNEPPTPRAGGTARCRVRRVRAAGRPTTHVRCVKEEIHDHARPDRHRPRRLRATILELRTREKAHTREGDAIAAARRRLPMTEVPPDTTVIGPDGPIPFGEVFEGRDELIVYSHMFHDGQPWEWQCEGCTRNTWNMGTPPTRPTSTPTGSPSPSSATGRTRTSPRSATSWVTRCRGAQRTHRRSHRGPRRLHRLLPAAGGQDLPDVLDDRPGRRGDEPVVRAARHDRLRAAGGGETRPRGGRNSRPSVLRTDEHGAPMGPRNGGRPVPQWTRPGASPRSAPAPSSWRSHRELRGRVVGPVGTEPTTGTAAQEVTSDLWCRVAPLRRTAAELEAERLAAARPDHQGGAPTTGRGRTPVTRRTPAEVRATASAGRRPPGVRGGSSRTARRVARPPRADSSASGKLQRRAMRYVVGQARRDELLVGDGPGALDPKAAGVSSRLVNWITASLRPRLSGWCQ